MWFSFGQITSLITIISTFINGGYLTKNCFINTDELISERMYKTNFMNNDLLLKMDNHFVYKDNIFHEYNVGLDLNELRDTIPNFVGTIGSFKCNIASNITKPCSIFNKKYERDYLLLEYINGKSLLNVSQNKEISDDEYQKIILQTILAINIAYEEKEFVHYDLHMKNIMIEKLPEPIKINYGFYNIYSSYIPRIIDFGRSYTKNVGGYEYVTCGVHPIKNNQHDIIYLLYTINKYMKRNINKYQQLRKRFHIYHQLRINFGMDPDLTEDACKLSKMVYDKQIIFPEFKRLSNDELYKLYPYIINKDENLPIKASEYIDIQSSFSCSLIEDDNQSIDTNLKLHVRERQFATYIPKYFQNLILNKQYDDIELKLLIDKMNNMKKRENLTSLLPIPYENMFDYDKDLLLSINNILMNNDNIQKQINELLYLIKNENIYIKSGVFYLLKHIDELNIVIDENTGLWYQKIK